MTWISEPNLVSLMSNLGAFGCLAAGNMPPEQFAAYVEQTRAMTDRPFAGNLITIAPNYQAHLDILCNAKVSPHRLRRVDPARERGRPGQGQRRPRALLRVHRLHRRGA